MHFDFFFTWNQKKSLEICVDYNFPFQEKNRVTSEEKIKNSLKQKIYWFEMKLYVINTISKFKL